MSFVCTAAVGLFGFTSKPIEATLGTRSRSSSSRFAPSSTERNVAPVIFPPGRFRLTTSPVSTGSLPIANTIGMVAGAALAASAAGIGLGKSTVTRRPHEITRHCWQSIVSAFLVPTIFDGDVAPLNETGIVKLLPKCLDEFRVALSWKAAQISHHRHRRLLRPRRER